MTKENIHPDLHSVSVVLNDGTEFKVMTTYGKEGDTMKLDIDPTNHPAWKSEQTTFVNTNNDSVAKFKKKFGDVFNTKK